MNQLPPRSSTMFPPPLLQRRLLADVIRNWRALLTVQPRVLAAELLNSGATSLIMCFPPLTCRVALHAPDTLPTNEALGLPLLISLCFTSAIHSGVAALIGLLAFPCNSVFILCWAAKKAEVSFPSGDNWKRHCVWTGASQDNSCELHWGRQVYCGYLSIRGC